MMIQPKRQITKFKVMDLGLAEVKLRPTSLIDWYMILLPVAGVVGCGETGVQLRIQWPPRS